MKKGMEVMSINDGEFNEMSMLHAAKLTTFWSKECCLPTHKILSFFSLFVKSKPKFNSLFCLGATVQIETLNYKWKKN